MRLYRALSLFFGATAGLLAVPQLDAQHDPNLRIVETIDSTELGFRLPDVSGKIVTLERHPERRFSVICFLGTECPLAKLYASRLNEMAKDLPSVSFIGVFSNQQDSLEELIAFRDQHRIGFSVVRDTDNVVADQFEAERTPEVFIVDHELTIKYRGRIDDQYQPGIAKSAPTHHDLRVALTECLSGKPVSNRQTVPEGCLIGRVKKPAQNASHVTYANQVSRIIQNHCSECHRPGEIGPMELSNYEEVSGWAEMIVEVVNEDRMPPWHADPRHGNFINERRMTSAEKKMLTEWVTAGTPQGDLSQLPPARVAAESNQWRLPREPDTVVAMRSKPFTVPAEGTVEYQYFVVDPQFEEDKWVIAAEILPGNRSVLHHSIVFVRPPDGAEFRGIGWLAAYVPGQSAPLVNPKFGRRIPAGSKLVFQQHYTPIGNPADDMTRIGLLFGDDAEIENEVFTILALDQEFVIPPGAPDYHVGAKFRSLPKNGSLMAFSPHMHFRGKSFELTAEFHSPANSAASENQSRATLLRVPNYDFNWQHIYQLKDPIPIDSIRSLEFVAAFDNSKANPANPDPTRHVMWGDQTWEEMAVAFAIVSQPRDSQQEKPPGRTSQQIAAQEKYDEFIRQRATTFTDQYFKRLDINRDGKIAKSELPRSVRDFGRWQLDENLDGVLTREEIHETAEYHLRAKHPPKAFDPILAPD